MKTIFTLLIVSFSLAGFAQTYDLKDFVKTPAPKPYSNEWYGSDNAKSFSPEIVNGKLIISDFNNKPAQEYELPYGKLWTINLGEFGGVLYYQPKDTTQKVINVNGKNDTLKNYSRDYYAISTNDKQVKAKLKNKQFELYHATIDNFFKFRDSLFFTHVLWEMSVRQGAIYKVDLKKDGGTITKALTFADAPVTMVARGNTIYMATFSKFYIFENWKKVLEIDDLAWEGIGVYHLAMADKNTFYVGLINGYARLDLKKKKLTFYKYLNADKK